MAEGSTTQERVAARVGAPSRECVYHVRVLQPWASESTLSETCSSSSARDTSFFGLELELHGVQTGTDPPAAASLALAFNHSAQLRDAFTASSALATLVGPFSIRVASKRAATTERNKRVRQTFAAVQPGNTLFEINGVRFLAACSTVHDVYKQLMRVATRVSLATPFELTFARHNHAQAAAKIVPFAMRTDVQRAQVAQYAKMQAHDAALSDAVRRKKLCITQQIDYEQEQYLLSHIGHDLVALHDATMANGQWQAYEFDQALWYFHAPTARLYAEHPMRSSDATRQLLGAVQFQTRFAVQRLQRAVRIAHRRSALETAAVHHGKLLEAIWQDVWDHAWMRIWQDEACASEPIAPLGAGPEPEAAAEAPTDPLGVDQEIVQLVQRWRARTAKTSTGPPALTLADVVKHGIPSLRAQEPACVPASATDKQPVDAAMPSSLEESVLASSASPPPPSAPPVALARPPAVVLVDESTQTPTPRALPIERDADETKRIEEERPVGPTAVVLAPTDTSALALPAEALADEAKDEAEAATDNEGNDEEDDDDDDRREWRASLTLLKASLQHKKAASPPKHAAQHFYSLASSPTQRTRVDAVGAKRAPGRTSGDRDDDDERVLPRVAQIDGVRLRTSSTIVPPPRSSMTPFVLKKALHGPTGSAYKVRAQQRRARQSVRPETNWTGRRCARAVCSHSAMAMRTMRTTERSQRQRR